MVTMLAVMIVICEGWRAWRKYVQSAEGNELLSRTRVRYRDRERHMYIRYIYIYTYIYIYYCNSLITYDICYITSCSRGPA